MKQIETLRLQIIERVKASADVSLLDLILKLLPPERDKQSLDIVKISGR